MATNIPDEAISIHNDMVYELSVSMTDQEFKRLKRLLGDVPLTATDKRTIKSVQELFSCLIDKTFIFYGNYEKLMPKLKVVKPLLWTIVERHAGDISKILKPEPEPELEDITIMMHTTVYTTWEGSSAAFINCKVDPVPDRIVWKRDKTTPLRKRVLNDNHKYFYSPESPTLVIRDPKKSMDEAQYQCWAEARGTNADGDIVQLQVAVGEPMRSTLTPSIPGPPGPPAPGPPGPPGPSADIPQTIPSTPGPSEDISKTVTSITGPSEDISQTTTSTPRPSKDVSKTTPSITVPSEDISQTTTSTPGPSGDISQTTVNIPPGSSEESDIESSIHHIPAGLKMLPRHRKRTRRQSDPQPYGKRVIIDQGCRIAFDVTNEIDITRRETEIDIIDGFKRATGVSGRVDEAKLKPSTPYVNISHSEFTVPVGKTAILQTYVITSTEATSIQWFKVEDGDHIAIEIDNQRYYGGSDVCPTLIIRETTIDDHGQYMCLATNSKRTGSSDTSSLCIVSEKLKKTVRTRRSYGAMSQSGREQETIDESSDVYTLLPEMKTLKQCSIPYEVTSICPTKNGEAWTCDGDRTLTLLDNTGTTKLTIRHTTWISDISLSPTTSMLWVCDINGDIFNLVSGRLVRRFGIRSTPFCICSTASNHVIVGTDYQITKYTPEGSPYTVSGELIARYPPMISECPVTHNVAITGYQTTYHGFCVILMDRHFKKLFVIDGKVDITPFLPWDIVFDNTGNLVIQDTSNNNIVLFSGQGKRLRILHADNTENLSAIGIDKDNVLWLCQQNILRLVQYYSDI